jgi:hypothetical protein
MRRSLLLGVGVLLLLIMGAIWLGCGGGRASSLAVNLTLTPIAASLNRGATAQITVTALDANNVAVAAPPLAFHSSNPAAITVSPAGLICAGQWDASFVNCYACSNPDLITNQCPANGGNLLPLGTANITATASTGNVTITSSTVVVTDHEAIDSVQVSMSSSIPGCTNSSATPPVTACVSQTCVSQNGTAPFVLQAFSHDPQACLRITGSTSTPCQVPSDTVGSVNWAVSPGQVATADANLKTATNPVCITASAPGQGVVAGSVGVAGSTVSGSSSFLTCALCNIHVHQQNIPTPPDTETSFTAPIGATVPLVADVFDSNNNPLTNTLALTWLTSQPALASVSQSTSQGATVQAMAPGTASISAACLPPSCNVNFVPLEPVYSDNVVTATITGTTDSTVLVTTSTPPANTSSSNNIVGIDTTTNTAGTTFILPENLVVNSMVISPTGDPVFLGTTCTAGTTIAANGLACSGLLRFDPTVSTVPVPTTTITGSVLTTDGNRVVVSDPTTNQVFIVTAAGPSIEATPLINVSSLITPTGATESGNTVTLTTTTPHGLNAGQSVLVAGVGVAGYNGVYKVDSVIGDPALSTSFTYTDPNAGLAASGGGYVTGGVSAAIAPDASKIYIVTGQGSPQSPPGGTLHVYRTGLPVISQQPQPPLKPLSVDPTSTQAVSFFPTSLMAYIANFGVGVDDLVALSPLPPSNCNNDGIVSSVAVGNSPTHIAAIPNAGLFPFGTSIPAMVDANSPSIDEVDVDASSASVCPLALTNSSTPNGFTVNGSVINSFTAEQLLVTPNSQLAIILTSDQGVLVYNLGTKQTSVITLAGTPAPQPLSGGVTPDSANLYVGATDGKVHRIDLTKPPPADAQSIAVSLCPSVTAGCNPDFVVVRPVATVATLTSLSITAPGNATPNAPRLNVGGTQQFKATGTFSDKTTRDMTNFVTWASSNQVVAVIGINTAVTPPLTTPGLARALATGTTTISATSAGVTGSIGLTVQ